MKIWLVLLPTYAISIKQSGAALLPEPVLAQIGDMGLRPSAGGASPERGREP